MSHSAKLMLTWIYFSLVTNSIMLVFYIAFDQWYETLPVVIGFVFINVIGVVAFLLPAFIDWISHVGKRH